MHIVLMSVLVVSAMCLVSSHKPHRGGPPHYMMMKFESCKPFYENIKKTFEELKEAKEIGPDVCQGEDKKDCKKEDAIKVRCATENPSEECIQEVTDFMNGNVCSAEV